MTYPNEGWPVPKPTSVADELTTVETAYGSMEKWKARALAIGWFQRVAESVRNDSAGASELGYETKPPPLAADAEEPSPVDPEWIEAIDKAVDALTVRVGKLEKRRAADAALDDLEAAIERRLPQSSGDDDDEVFARDLKPKH